VRRVTTASGATAVQIMHKRGRRVLGIEHIGSAHTEADLAVLVEVARVRLHAGQEQLPWELESDTGPTGPAGLEPLVEGTASLLLWDALAGVNHHDRPPAPHSRATRPYPDPTDPRRPHPECALKRANSGLRPRCANSCRHSCEGRAAPKDASHGVTGLINACEPAHKGSKRRRQRKS